MKAQYLSRRLAKERTTCPSCKKALQVGTLAWSHKCRVAKPLPDHVVQCRLDKQREMAVKSFQQRMAKEQGTEPDCLMEAAPLEDPAIEKATVDGAGNITVKASQEGQEGGATSQA